MTETPVEYLKVETHLHKTRSVFKRLLEVGFRGFMSWDDVAMDQSAILDAYEVVKKSYRINFQLRDHQLLLISASVNKKHSMGIVATGGGKSLAYCLVPLLLDVIEPDKAPHVSLVVSPLRSLMADQVEKLKTQGVRAAAIMQWDEMDDSTREGIGKGQFSVVLASPEALSQEHWQAVLRKKPFRRMISLVAIDEAHCVIHWGSSFRPEYLEITSLPAILNLSTFMLLTATCTPKMKAEMLLQFGLQDVKVFASVPNRSNIYLEYRSTPGMSMEQELAPYIQELREKGVHARKCIIYTTVDAAGRVYEHTVATLRDRCFSLDGKRMVDLYVAKSPEADKMRVMQIFPKPDSIIRLLVATCAFGMGVDIPDVDLIIHWGGSSTVLSYWQEVGRAGRDGRQAEAVMLATPVSVMNKRMCEDCVRAVQKKVIVDKVCVRAAVLQTMYLDCMPPEEMASVLERQPCSGETCDFSQCDCSLCKCCNICRGQCPCRK